jgi:hypothetical protein
MSLNDREAREGFRNLVSSAHVVPRFARAIAFPRFADSISRAERRRF